MAQTTLLNGLTYAKGTVNQDLRNVKLAARTAVQPFEPVILSQLESYLTNLSASLGGQISDEVNNRTASNDAINSLIASNFSTLTDAIQGVNNKETVAARVLTYAELAAPISGVDYNSATTNYRRWVLVDNDSDATQNGIYYQQPTATPNVYTAVRVPEWSTPEAFNAGLEVFVDAGTFQNTVYWVFDSAVIDEQSGSFSVGFIPWQRPEFIQIDNNLDSGFLSKIGNKIRAQINDTYFSVVSGDLTWSAALVTWKSTVDAALVELASLQDTVEAHSSQIGSLESTVAGQTVSISGLSTDTSSLRTDVNTLQSADTTQSSAIAGLRTDVDAATTKNSQQDGRLTTLEASDTTQSSAIVGLRTDVDAATTKNSQQDGRLDAVETLNTQQDSRLNAIETVDGQQNTRLTTLETSEANQTSLLSGLRTDVDTATTKNTSQDTRLTSLESSDSSQDNLIAGLRTDVDAATTKDSQQDGRLTTLEASDTTQSSAIAGLRTDVDAAGSKNTEQDTRLTSVETVNSQQNTRLDAVEASDTTQSSAIAGLRTDVDAASTKNTQQDTRLDTVEATTSSLVSEIAALPATTDVNNIVLNFLRAGSIRKTLTGGSSSVVDGINETTFNVDVTSQIAILGAGAAFRLVTLNDAATPYTQSSDPIVTYPNLNTVAVTLQSESGNVPDNIVEVSLQAFFS